MQSTRINLLSLLCFMALVVASPAQSTCGVVGKSSQIICVSRSTFKLNDSDETIFSCPSGLFCADVPEVCTNVGLAACNTAKICSQCLPNSISTCVDSKKYVICESGQLAGNEKYCQASKPYCSMQYDANGVANSVCTNIIGDVACDTSTVPTPSPNATEPTEPCSTLPTPTEPCTPEPLPTEPCTCKPKPPVDPETCSVGQKISITTDVDCKSCDVNISILIRDKKDSSRN